MNGAQMPHVDREVFVMWVLIALLVLFVVFGVLGFVIKGLLWLAIIGIVLFLATAVFAGIKNRSRAS